MIEKKNNLYSLSTDHTTYAFRVLETGQLEHLYYGKKIKIHTVDSLVQKRVFPQGNMIAYDQEHLALSLEDMPLEFSSRGKGDIKEPFLEVVYSDGSRTSDFGYVSDEITSGKKELEGLPSSYGEEDDVESLEIQFKDKNSDLRLYLTYCVYKKTDVITRTARIENQGTEAVSVERLLSMQLDMPAEGICMTSFHGTWAREMDKCEVKLTQGRFLNASECGSSSSRANPFVMLHDEKTNEEHGACYGFNLVYSGNHYEIAEVTAFQKCHFLMGMNPNGSSFLLEAGECLQAPEAIMTFSKDGFGGMSRQMHAFVRNHIVRGEWKTKERPVLLNSWEAAYFDIDENKLLRLAKAAQNVGIELFVMDDGWFGKRNDDSCSLGDWTVNEKKLPNGLKGLGDKINQLGLQFGIWVEPEMVNVDSDLYRKHPNWAMEIPGKHHSEGRNQRILDLCNPEVQEYLIQTMSQVFESGPISYVKWDMNRIFSDVYSPYLNVERQGEVSYRYMVGLYHIMDELTKRFPKILFEGCAAGGNRFDLGILSFFPQIWASDDTDAYERARIQTNYSYGYPMSTVSAHVSACPNHQTLRDTPLMTRFNVAAYGVLGYECNLVDMASDELKEIKSQINNYKKWRKTLQYGDFYRDKKGDLLRFNVVNEEKTEAVTMMMQDLTRPNPLDQRIYVKGLDEDTLYHFYNLPYDHDLMEFGDLVNTQAPIHVRQDSLLHKAIAHFVPMKGEVEDYLVFGDSLAEAGILLKQPFSATGYSDQVRHFPDFASRMYFVKAEENKKDL